jgi:hypothetical protein
MPLFTSLAQSASTKPCKTVPRYPVLEDELPAARGPQISERAIKGSLVIRSWARRVSSECRDRLGGVGDSPSVPSMGYMSAPIVHA